MRLRKMELIDKPLMFEWMYDESVTCWLRTSLPSKTQDDHYTYIGMVSIKNIDSERRCAKFAIAMFSCVMGKNFSIAGITSELEVLI